jgi:hypothetical protein
MADREITCDVLKVYSEKKGRNTVRIQVVKWGKYPPVLEKREFWYDDQDAEKTGKAKGFNREDFQLLMDNAQEIQNLLQ